MAKDDISRHERDVLDFRLRRQQSIEWIALAGSQKPGVARMLKSERERLEVEPRDDLQEVVR